jgi:hypothetical protein
MIKEAKALKSCLKIEFEITNDTALRPLRYIS